MAAEAGFDMVISKNSVAIAGCRSGSVNWSAEPIDIGSGEDAGVRTLMPGKATSKAVEIQVEGVWKDKTIRDAAVGSNLMLTDVTVALAGSETLSGDFFLSAYSETGEYQDAVMFSGTLMSSGAMVVS